MKGMGHSPWAGLCGAVNANQQREYVGKIESETAGIPAFPRYPASHSRRPSFLS